MPETLDKDPPGKRRQQQQQADTCAAQSSMSADMNSSHTEQQEEEHDLSPSSMQPTEHSQGAPDSDAAEDRPCSTDDHSLKLVTQAQNPGNGGQGTSLGQ